MDEQPVMSREDLRSVATYQKGILLCILAYFGLMLAQFVLSFDDKLILGIVLGILGIVATVFVFLLATKVFGTVLGTVFGVLTMIPCVGLIILLIVNGKATSILKKHGIGVGLLGANLSDIK